MFSMQRSNLLSLCQTYARWLPLSWLKEFRTGRFYTASSIHYLMVALVVSILNMLAGALVVGFAAAIPFVFIFVIRQLGRFAGRHICRLAYKAAQGNRGKHMPGFAGVCLVAGTTLVVFVGWLMTLSWWVPFIALYLIGAYQGLTWQVN